MGYCTSYTLTWTVYKNTASRPNCEHAFPKTAKFCPECGSPVGMVTPNEQIMRAIEEGQKGDPDWLYGITPDGSGSESCKWYEHEKEVAELSRRFPTVLFTLHGEGEETGDIWNMYFINGRSQKAKAKIVIPEFDPKLLGSTVATL